MKRVFISIACSAAVVAFANTAVAQGKGGGPKVKVTSRPVATSHGGAGTSHGKSSPVRTAAAPKSTVRPAKANAGSVEHGHAKTATTKATNEHARSRTTTTTTPTTTPSTTPASGATLTPVQQKLQRNTHLAAKLESRLPAGTNLNTAASGFKNLGQFVAAVNVSNNLGLDFTTLKTAMVTDGKSLGQAIQAQKGTTTTESTRQAQVAERDANTQIRASEDQSRKAQDRKTKTNERGRP